MKHILLLAPAALVLATARPLLPPEKEPRLPYADLDFGDDVTFSLAPATAAPRRVEPEPPEGALRVLVSIPQQRAYVFRRALLASAPVSTGRRGHPTPVGTFRILQKQIHHRSNIYSNAPMPYMQRLTSYGIALHAGHLPGYPASHGCIRLPWGFARRLYGMTDASTRVTITRQHVRLAARAEETAN